MLNYMMLGDSVHVKNTRRNLLTPGQEYRAWIDSPCAYPPIVISHYLLASQTRNEMVATQHVVADDVKSSTGFT